MITTFMAIIFNLLKLVESTWPILIGRLGFGICTGIQSLIMGKALSETVPSTEQQRYMVWINLSITFGMLVAQIFNMFLPL